MPYLDSQHRIKNCRRCNFPLLSGPRCTNCGTYNEQDYHPTKKEGSELMSNYYVRKPLVVEAYRLTEENLYDVAKWCDGEVHTNAVDGRYVLVDVLHPTTQAQKIAKPGSWILRSSQGFKIFTDRAFTRGFEPTGDLVDQLTDEVKTALHKIGAEI